MSGKKKIGIAVAGGLLVAILVALGVYKVFFAPKSYTQNLTDPALSAAVVADYTASETERSETFASGSKGYSWENGDPFNVWWKAENAVYDGGKLTLRLSEMTQKEQVWSAEGTASDCLSEYYGAEVRSEHYYGYGDFQVRMKPAAIPGTASTFFTCTGPYDVWYNADGSVQRANDHDEIDIEFLGKDTTKVQFNYFASGKGGHEYMYDLGFDASKDFHNYGYRWSEESITWFVDDKPVYKVFRSEIPSGEDWPEDPGRIVMNYWCGTANAALWMGTFKDDYSSGAEYEWVATSAAAQPDPSSTKLAAAGQPADQPNGELENQLPDTQWAQLDLSAFDGWGKYTVAKDGDKVTISHDKKLQKYDCCGVDVNLGSRNKVSYTVTNNGTEKAFAKVSIKNTSGDKSAITSATINGGDAGYYEYGVLCELAPSESADVVMLLDLGQKPSQMVVSLNSEADAEGKNIREDMPKTGKIVISALQAVKSDETALPGAGQSVSGGEQAQQSGTPKAPEGPVTEWAALDLAAFDGWGKYTVAKDGDKVTVSHGKKLQKYDCCGVDVNLGTRNKVAYTVTNIGSEKAYAKVSIKNTSGDRSAITSATINGGDAGYYEYGVLCELEPGKSADVVMLLDLGQKPSQIVVSLNSEADSEGKAIRSDMPKTGKIVISGLQAVKSGETVLPGAAPKTQQPSQPGQPQQPQIPNVPATELAALELSGFDGWGKYAVAKVDGAVTVSHDNTVAMYDCCGVDIALGERNKVQFSLTNNGAAKAFAKVNVKDRADSTGVSSIRTAAVNGVVVDYVQYGVLCELEPGQTVDVEIYTDGVHPADQLVLSLNSEGDSEGKALRSDMPSSGSVILSNLRAVKTDVIPTAPAQPQQPSQPDQPQQPTTPNLPDTQWADVALTAVDGWGKYTLTKAAGSFTVSHDKTVAMYDCCGGEIALGSRNKVKLTLTNNGTEKAYAKVNINDKTITTGISSISSATINGADAGYIEYGVLCELPAGGSAQVELLLAPGKAADQLIISLNSEGDSEGKTLRSDMPKTGKITVSNVQAMKTDETALTVGVVNPAEPNLPAKPVIAEGPLDEWAAVDFGGFDGWGSYTVEKADGSMTMSHDKALKQYACAGMSFEPGERNKVKMTIKNNGEETAQAKVSIKSDKVDKSAIMGATVDGKGVGNVKYGVMCKIPAGKSVELVVFLNLKKDVKQFVVSLNSDKTHGMPTAGSITISEVKAIQSDEKFTLASSALGGSGGGGGGGSVSAPPAKPDEDGKLTLAPTSGSGWNSTTIAAPAEDGNGVTLSHTSKQGVYGNFSWPVDMEENNRLELDVVNNADVKAYAKVSLTTEGDDSGKSVLDSATVEKTAVSPARFRAKSRVIPGPMSALLRSGGPVAVDDVLYGVMCELEPHESAHMVLIVKQDKISEANKLVVSLNSESEDGTNLTDDMPSTGSVTLKNIVCGKAEPVVPDPGPSFTDPTTEWDLSGFDGWGMYTVTEADGAVTISHTEERDQWHCCGIGGVDFGDAESVMFTVTNNDAANQAKLRFKVVSKVGDDEVNAVKAATVAVDGGDPVSADNPAEVDIVLAPGKSAVVRLAVDPEKHANQMTVFLNSTDAAGRIPAGSVTISSAKWDKENDTPVTPGPEPVPGGDGVMMGQTKLTFDKNNEYTVRYADDKTSMTVSYAGVKRQSYINVNTSIKDIVGIGDTLKFTVKNNKDAAMKLGVKIEGETQSDVVCDKTEDIAANGQKAFEIKIEGTVEPKTLYFFIDSVYDTDTTTEHSGELTFSNFALTKAGGGDEPEDDGLTDMGLTTLTGVWGYTVEGLNIKYDDGARSQWMNAKEMVDFGNATTVKFAIKNNHASNNAIVKVKLEKAIDDNNGTPHINSGKVTVDGTEVSEGVTVDDGLMYTIPAGKTAVYEITVDEGAVDRLVIFLNSLEDPNTITEGDITITSARWNRTEVAAASLNAEMSLFSLDKKEETPAENLAQPPAPQPAPPPVNEVENKTGDAEAAPPATPPAQQPVGSTEEPSKGDTPADVTPDAPEEESPKEDTPADVTADAPEEESPEETPAEAPEETPTETPEEIPMEAPIETPVEEPSDEEQDGDIAEDQEEIPGQPDQNEDEEQAETTEE